MKEGLPYYDFLLRIYWLHTLFFLAYRRTLSLPITTWLSLSSKVGRNYSYRLPISQGPSEQLSFRKEVEEEKESQSLAVREANMTND